MKPKKLKKRGLRDEGDPVSEFETGWMERQTAILAGRAAERKGNQGVAKTWTGSKHVERTALKSVLDYKGDDESTSVLDDRDELEAREATADYMDNVNPNVCLWDARPSRAPTGELVAFVDNGPHPARQTYVAANDNEQTVAWPLAKELRREKRFELLDIACAYRVVYEMATVSNPLFGTAQGNDFVSWVQSIAYGDDGELKYKGAKKLKGSAKLHGVGTHAHQSMVYRDDDSADSDPMLNKRSVKDRWNGDARLLNQIEAKPVLAEIERCLGPLVQPTERAVIDCWTLERVGREEGSGYTGQWGGPQANAAAKGLVYRGLYAVGGYFGQSDVRASLRSLGITLTDQAVSRLTQAA